MGLDQLFRATGHPGADPEGGFANSAECPCMGDSAREVIEE
jgi:hypothetical protein